MARAIAIAYKNCIIRGIRVIDQVRPDDLKKEVQELLIAEGREDLAGVVKEETPTDKKEDEAPTDSTEGKEEPIKDDEPKEDEPQPVEDKEG